MIGRFISPLLSPLWKTLRSASDAYGITPLSYKILITISFLSAPSFAATQMNRAALASFLLCLMVNFIYRFTDKIKKPGEPIFLYALCGFSVFATAFGVAENYGMPVAFMFLSWLVLSLVYAVKTDGFRLIDSFEIGLASAAILFAPIYIPAITILFGLACLASAGLTFLVDLKKKD